MPVKRNCPPGRLISRSRHSSPNSMGPWASSCVSSTFDPRKIDRMISAIIVAAGSGTRMGDKVDKLFLEVANRPIIAHTWDRYDRHELVTEIVLVVREGQQTAFGQLASRCNFRKPHRIVVGGAERQDSVWNGL